VRSWIKHADLRANERRPWQEIYVLAKAGGLARPVLHAGRADTLTVTDSGNGSYSYLYGDAQDMYDSAQGGADTLTAINTGDGSFSYLRGESYAGNWVMTE